MNTEYKRISTEYDKIDTDWTIDNVIQKYGFEAPETVEFCRLCEEDESQAIAKYNNLMRDTEWNCGICGVKCYGGGMNPFPIIFNSKHKRCCGHCGFIHVMPARANRMMNNSTSIVSTDFSKKY